MLKFLLKVTEEYRLETMEDVDAMKEEFKASPQYNLSSFTWTKKPVKEGGEVVDCFYQVKAVKVFQELKDANRLTKDVIYDIQDGEQFEN